MQESYRIDIFNKNGNLKRTRLCKDQTEISVFVKSLGYHQYDVHQTNPGFGRFYYWINESEITT